MKEGYQYGMRDDASRLAASCGEWGGEIETTQYTKITTYSTTQT